MNTCYNPFSLEGKRILVTGASSGIGKAIAMECAKMGAQLIISARNIERLNYTMSVLEGEGHLSIPADLSVETDCISLSDTIDSLDGCVLCLGVTQLAPVQFATRCKFEKVFDSNFFAPVELTRLLIKKKKLARASSIVCISSVGGNFSFDVAHSIYGSSKAALSSWMKFAAKELAPKRIRVNNICPGMTRTLMAAPGTVSSEQLAEDEMRYPLKRYAEPKEIALAVVYLLSDASTWVTGTDFIIDGGLSLT